MARCEHCGANAVDATGVCRACGWHTEAETMDLAGETPSLGETRAADVPAPARPPLLVRRDTPQGPSPRGAGPSGPPSRATGRVASVGTRYCGTCGARIEPGEQYCGQCGTPLAAGAPTSGTELRTALRPTPSLPGHYRSEAGLDDDAWQPYDNDAPTEAYAPSVHPGMGQSYPGYGRSMPGAYTGTYPVAARHGPNRELRVVLGILCILGGLVSGAGAIILAFVGR